MCKIYVNTNNITANARKCIANANTNRIIRRIARFALEYGAALAVGAILYKLCRRYAVACRGNTSLGGEVFMLAMPIWYGMAKSVVKDGMYAIRAWREMRK